ncbi:MAG: hypothetical protein Q8P18_34025 [Pseudomonadota bacterium]|nr:hypothetical protein [Pseudomonadota bacterium]
MQNDLLNRLRKIEAKMMNAWPDYAADLVALPHAADLTLRDFATLLLLAPGEHVARPAVEVALGGRDVADIAISGLAGHSLVVEESKGLILTTRGRELLDALADIRAVSAQRVLSVLPKSTQAQMVQGLEELANAIHRAEALEKA